MLLISLLYLLINLSQSIEGYFEIKSDTASLEMEEFEEEYEVPVIGANPVEAGLVRDFFQQDSKSYSRINDAGSLYSSLSSYSSIYSYKLLFITNGSIYPKRFSKSIINVN